MTLKIVLAVYLALFAISMFIERAPALALQP
jgi:hypothetical protein